MAIPVITGLGLVSSLGDTLDRVRESLHALKHGFEPVQWLGNPKVANKVVGTVKGYTLASADWRDWTYPHAGRYAPEVMRSLSPQALYGLIAIEKALEDAGLTRDAIADGRTGLFTASAGSPFMLHAHLTQMDRAAGERGSPNGVVASIAGTLNFNLATYFQITGAVCGFVSACASSAHAIGYAMDEIRLGRQDRVIVIGAEEIAAETVLPFGAMRALSVTADPAKASRPFDVRRDGFVATGGAAVVVVESREIARQRNAPVYAELAGWGQASDGHNVAISHPEGRGLARAMTQALADAKLSPEAVEYINAHATSTQVGDRSEARAIRSVFGAVPNGGPAVSSTKALTGHALSMAGALETAICALALREGFVPGCAHLEEVDPECAGLNLPRETLSRPIGTVLNNSSGFGGSNVTLVLQRPTT